MKRRLATAFEAALGIIVTVGMWVVGDLLAERVCLQRGLLAVLLQEVLSCTERYDPNYPFPPPLPAHYCQHGAAICAYDKDGHVTWWTDGEISAP